MQPYEDAVYGSVLISEPVLVELIASAAMQRLQGVLQHGISALIGLTQPITRFDHSVGAMLLVRRLHGSMLEQIAALLHDVSHTAFSHVIDYVFDGHDSQSYHDEKKETYLQGTDIPAILAKYGYEWRDFLDEGRSRSWSSLRLACALTGWIISYAMPRDWDWQRPLTFNKVLAHLVVAAGRIAVNDIEVARWLGYTFIAADDASWANFREVGLYEITAQAIRRGLTLGVITEADFWLTDEPVWTRLHTADDAELQALLRHITAETRFVWDEQQPTFWVSTKLRTIDPDVVVNGRLIPLSQLDPDFAAHRETYLASKAGKWPMRVLPVKENTLWDQV
ncbi:MAG: HD domain-containing protein [Chloroflexi bacterium]|nr:HD domain-containing protein [Chloroflexota bacterium]